MPASLVRVWTDAPVFSFTIVISMPGSAAPVASFAFPVIALLPA